MIKINKNPIQTDLDVLKSNLPPPKAISIPECFYPNTIEKVENLTCRASKFSIRHSVYKLAIVAKAVQGMHLYDA